jgi:hypothetical protein
LAALLAVAATGRSEAQEAGPAVGVPPPTPVATDAAATKEPALDLAVLAGTNWFGYYENDIKIGWIRSSVTVENHPVEEGGPRVAVETAAEVRLAAVGKRSSVELLDRKEYAATEPHLLLRARNRTTRAGSVIEVSATRKGEVFEILETLPGEEPVTRTAPAPAETLRDSMRDRLLVLRNAPVGTEAQSVSFDLTERRAFTDRLRVKSVGKKVEEGLPVAITMLEYVQGKSEKVWTLTFDAAGDLLLAQGEGRLRFVAEPEEEARRIEFGADGFYAHALQPDQPLGYGPDVHHLVIRIHGIAEGVVLPDDGRQTSTRDEDGVLRVTIRSTAKGPWLPATETDMAEALIATTVYPCDHPEMQKAAAVAVDGAKTPREKAERLTTWVSGHVRDQFTLQDLTALDTLRRARGDCSEHTVLFVALARAAGLPTRRVSGIMYGDDSLGFSSHAWAEVALDGRWVPFDPTWNQVVIDASHLRLEVENLFDHSRIVQGDVRIEVVEFR